MYNVNMCNSCINYVCVWPVFITYRSRKRTARTYGRGRLTMPRISTPTQCRTGNWWYTHPAPPEGPQTLGATSTTNTTKPVRTFYRIRRLPSSPCAPYKGNTNLWAVAVIESGFVAGPAALFPVKPEGLRTYPELEVGHPRSADIDNAGHHACAHAH